MRDDLITVRQAAEEKGVSMQAIYKRIHAGDLTSDKIGTLYVIRRDEAYESYTPQSQPSSSDKSPNS